MLSSIHAKYHGHVARSDRPAVGGLRRFDGRSFERGLSFRAGEFSELVGPGWVVRFDPFGRSSLDVVSLRAPWLVHKDLDLVVRS